MKTHKTVAQILKQAIEFLWDGYGGTGYTYSCAAVYIVYSRDLCSHLGYLKAIDFLEKLGVNSRSYGQFEDVEFASHVERQQARALWLTWAAMIAEEEGI